MTPAGQGEGLQAAIAARLSELPAASWVLGAEAVTLVRTAELVEATVTSTGELGTVMPSSVPLTKSVSVPVVVPAVKVTVAPVVGERVPKELVALQT